ncbi:hypothetical protein PMZ80_011061 [Knufia obscura]|uniref:FAD-binding domain-containing protein n=1 Tax=Knufia obscura TaxID=1635080 RepID=A0ABR0R7X5_9EURO|nr:hypothetical protein PMZ80_011061 [Knufia obscura]
MKSANGTCRTGGDTTKRYDVCIVGAGPVGTYLTVMLAHAGLNVIAVDSLVKLADEPRAFTHMPFMFKEFEKAGILEQMRELSKFRGDAISYRRTKDQQVIERLAPIPNRPLPLAVPQRNLTELLIDKLNEFPNGELRFGHRVVNVEQKSDDISVTLEVVQTNETSTLQCKYLVGADGAKSTIRKFMGIRYEGTTLPFKLIAADVVFPFEKYGFNGANFMLDPENFGMIALTSENERKETIWRVSIGFPIESSDDEIVKALPDKFQRLLEDLKPGQYTLLKAQPYEAHQFCTPTMKKGRTMLIGDSAHLCNPYSGQLLACGIFDASSLSQCLVSVIQHGAPESLLDEWNEDRVSKFKDVLDPFSKECFAATRDPDADTIAERHPFLKAMKAGPKGQLPTIHTDVTKLKSWRSGPN